jgi:predicted transcriptional regulator
MESKCNLTLINNNFLKRRADKEAKEHEISDKGEQLQKLYKETSNLKQQIAS